jgi:hypothetical protein
MSCGKLVLDFFFFSFEVGIILERWAGVLFELWRPASPQGGRMKYAYTLADSVIRRRGW